MGGETPRECSFFFRRKGARSHPNVHLWAHQPEKHKWCAENLYPLPAAPPQAAAYGRGGRAAGGAGSGQARTAGGRGGPPAVGAWRRPGRRPTPCRGGWMSRRPRPGGGLGAVSVPPCQEGRGSQEGRQPGSTGEALMPQAQDCLQPRIQPTNDHFDSHPKERLDCNGFLNTCLEGPCSDLARTGSEICYTGQLSTLWLPIFFSGVLLCSFRFSSLAIWLTVP